MANNDWGSSIIEKLRKSSFCARFCLRRNTEKDSERKNHNDEYNQKNPFLEYEASDDESELGEKGSFCGGDPKN